MSYKDVAKGVTGEEKSFQDQWDDVIYRYDPKWGGIFLPPPRETILATKAPLEGLEAQYTSTGKEEFGNFLHTVIASKTRASNARQSWDNFIKEWRGQLEETREGNLF